MGKPGCSETAKRVYKASILLKVVTLGLFGINLLGLVLHITSTPLHASGFALYTTGATELAQCDSVIAHTEGSASNFYNPALLLELEGTHIEIGTIPLKPSVDFRSDSTGQKTSMKSNIFYPSTLFVSHKINARFSAGLGINSTFGLGTEWRDNWEGRYLATNSELTAFNINPNLAWKVSDKLVLAGGFDILLGDAILEQKVELSLLALPDANQKVEANGEGYGYNLGILYKIAEDLTFGMSYRSGIKLKLEGDIDFTLPPGTPPGLFLNTDVKIDLDLPARIFAGISYKPSENIVFEVGGKWEEWSSYRNIKLRFDDFIPAIGGTTYQIEKNWKDVYGFNAGIKYSIDPTLSVSAGYLHEGNPIPSDTLEPAVPASNRDDFSIGIQKTFERLKVALSYLYDKYESRDKNNAVVGNSVTGITANGKYEQDIHMIGLSVSYTF
jgi:long-chain fatty acid transport protein